MSGPSEAQGRPRFPLTRRAPVDPLPIVQYWHSAQPPEDVVDLLASFPRMNPRLPQILFDEQKAEAFIAEHFSARELAAFRACAVVSMRADLFRYCAGYVLGGFVLDADVRCLGELDSLLSRGDRAILFGRRDRLADRLESAFGWPRKVGPFRAVVNGAFVFKNSGDPFLRLAVEVATANVEHRVGKGAEGVWVTTGPGVPTSLYLRQMLGSDDAFTRYAKGTVLESSAGLLCEIVGASEADLGFDGIEMVPIETVGRWLKHVGTSGSSPGVSHWSNPPVSIFS